LGDGHHVSSKLRDAIQQYSLLLTIPRQILSTIAVVLRFYVRGIVYKRLGWDDAAVFLAWAALVVGNTFVCLCESDAFHRCRANPATDSRDAAVNAGLGKHFDTLSFIDIKVYLFVRISPSLLVEALLLTAAPALLRLVRRVQHQRHSR
jgi:hypothetical protein